MKTPRLRTSRILSSESVLCCPIWAPGSGLDFRQISFEKRTGRSVSSDSGVVDEGLTGVDRFGLEEDGFGDRLDVGGNLGLFTLRFCSAFLGENDLIWLDVFARTGTFGFPGIPFPNLFLNSAQPWAWGFRPIGYIRREVK